MKITNYYSTQELAEILGKSRQQVSLDCRLGKIKCQKFGKAYFIHRNTVRKLLELKRATL